MGKDRMKVIKDGKGKLIFDFAGQEIDVSDVDVNVSAIDFCTILFNGDIISEIRNGVWLFGDKKLASAASGERT